MLEVHAFKVNFKALCKVNDFKDNALKVWKSVPPWDHVNMRQYICQTFNMQYATKHYQLISENVRLCK